jgi:hypothetical protein
VVKPVKIDDSRVVVVDVVLVGVVPKGKSIICGKIYTVDCCWGSLIKI